MIFTPIIQKAFIFAIKVHEIDRKQKRKGKDIPYLVHPLSFGRSPFAFTIIRYSVLKLN